MDTGRCPLGSLAAVRLVHERREVVIARSHGTLPGQTNIRSHCYRQNARVISPSAVCCSRDLRSVSLRRTGSTEPSHPVGKYIACVLESADLDIHYANVDELPVAARGLPGRSSRRRLASASTPRANPTPQNGGRFLCRALSARIPMSSSALAPFVSPTWT